MHKAFEVHMLNEVGKVRAAAIAGAFDQLAVTLSEVCPEGRELAVAMTKLEEACFFAKKAIAREPENQLRAETVRVLAEDMFNAYNEQGPNPWKTFDGRDVPRWSELNDQVRAKWEAAARAAEGK